MKKPSKYSIILSNEKDKIKPFTVTLSETANLGNLCTRLLLKFPEQSIEKGLTNVIITYSIPRSFEVARYSLYEDGRTFMRDIMLIKPMPKTSFYMSFEFTNIERIKESKEPKERIDKVQDVFNVYLSSKSDGYVILYPKITDTLGDLSNQLLERHPGKKDTIYDIEFEYIFKENKMEKKVVVTKQKDSNLKLYALFKKLIFVPRTERSRQTTFDLSYTLLDDPFLALEDDENWLESYEDNPQARLFDSDDVQEDDSDDFAKRLREDDHLFFNDIPESFKKPNTCQNCERIHPNLNTMYVCSGCNEALYCGTSCQIQHWNRYHKSACSSSSLTSSSRVGTHGTLSGNIV